MKAATIGISVRDAEDKPVRPPVLDLETTYTLRISITNQTKTAGGELWEALLEIGIEVSLDGIDIVPYTIQAVQFAPNQVQYFIPQIYVKTEYAGMTGTIRAEVIDPFGNLLASGEVLFEIGYTISPEAKYQVEVQVDELKGIDMPFLNPELGNSEGVVIGGVGGRPPPPPPAPKVKPSPVIPMEEVRLGIDTRTKPEPPVEFEGETPVDGRIG